MKCRNEEKLYDDVIFSDEGIAGLLGCYTLFESENCNKNNWKIFKRSVWLDMVVELISIRRFYGAYLFRKSANSIFRISFSIIQWRPRKMYSKKFYSKLISCLGTGWEQKINKISSKISNLIQLLVSEMSHCSKTFSVDFLEFLLKRRHLKKSANKFLQDKKFNLMMKKK